MPPGVPFPQFATALTNGTDKPDLHLRSGIAIIPPPRPAFVGGKGSPCKKKKGSLCEEESYSLVRSQRISRQGGRGKNNIQISEGSNRFLTGRGRGRGFLHPARQGQAHRRFRARQGSGSCNLGTRSLLWRRMSEWPSAALDTTTRSLTAAGQAIQSIPACNCKNMASLPVPEFVSWCSLVSAPAKTFSRNQDPQRSYAGMKSRSAAVSPRTEVCYRSVGSTGGTISETSRVHIANRWRHSLAARGARAARAPARGRGVAAQC